VRNHLHPSQNEGAHDDLAELGIGLDQSQQVFVIELDHLARLADAYSGHRPAAGQHVDFARKLARAVHDDQRFRSAVWPNNLELTRLHHKDRCDAVSLLDKDFAEEDRTRASMRRDTRHLRRRQLRKDVIKP
jgi:hypothetical protein